MDAFVCLFVCLFNRSLRTETHLGPDGTRLKRNVQARLKSLYKACWPIGLGNVKRETDLKIRDEGKEGGGVMIWLLRGHYLVSKR